MNDATVRFGYDGTALNAGLAEGERKLAKFGTQAERHIGRASRASEQMGRNLNKRGGFTGLGNVSMQLQDVAVQMQSGTKASIIFAQQGSQMLSAFGPLGMIAGAAAAVGGALYMMGEKSSEAFKKSVEGAKAFRESLNLTLATASLDNISSNLQTVSMQLDNATAEAEKFYSMGGMLGAFIADIQGDKSANEKIRELRKMQAEADDAYGLLIERSLQDGEKQIEIIEARARGEEAIADEMERQLKHQKELAKIDAQKIPEYAKEEMRRMADRRLAAEQQIAANKTKPDSDADKDLAKRRDQINLSKADLNVLELYAAGRDKAAKALEKEQAAQRRMRELMDQGMDPNTAADYVQREAAAREKIERRKGGGDRTGHIGGVTRRRFMESGLDQFYRNQEKVETGIGDPARPGYARGQQVPRYNAFNVPQTTAMRTGRMMGGLDQGSLSGRAARAPGSPDASRAAAAAKPADVGGKIDKTNELLARGLLGG